MTDEFLIQQILKGQTDAFRFLILRYQRPLFKFLSAFNLGSGSTEELAQETFLRAYRSLADFDPSLGASFSTWLFTIARNLALNEASRSHRKEELPITDREESPVLNQPDARPDPEAALAGEEQRQGFFAALERLPGEFRNALALSYLQELSLDEVAKIENCSVGTVKSRVFRAKQMLRALLAARKAEV